MTVRPWINNCLLVFFWFPYVVMGALMARLPMGYKRQICCHLNNISEVLISGIYYADIDHEYNIFRYEVDIIRIDGP